MSINPDPATSSFVVIGLKLPRNVLFTEMHIWREIVYRDNNQICCLRFHDILTSVRCIIILRNRPGLVFGQIGCQVEGRDIPAGCNDDATYG